jgi:hypothetical protein
LVALSSAAARSRATVHPRNAPPKRPRWPPDKLTLGDWKKQPGIYSFGVELNAGEAQVPEQTPGHNVTANGKEVTSFGA